MDGEVSATRLEVFRNYLAGVAEEGWEAFKRSGYSLNIKERGDCSAAVFAWDGQMLAVPNAGVPLHQGSMEGLVYAILERYPVESIEPGDMFITNDPFNGGSTHTMDYCLAAPLFSADGELLAFVANVGHHADIGGRVPGSMASDNESIFEEGLLVPPLRLCRAGEVIPEIVQIIAHNSREPYERAGDIHAHRASNHVMLHRLGEIAASFGREQFKRYCEALLDYSAHRLRVLLHDFPDGEWEAVDWIDGDGVGSEPVRLRLVMRKQDDSLTLDWSDVPAQWRSGRNVPLLALKVSCFTVMRALLDPGMHINSGISRVVRYVTTPGSCLHPVFPAAVSDRATVCSVLADMTARCIGQMAPEHAMAAMGSFQGWGFSGYDPRKDKWYANYESIAGGLGATTFADGMDAVRGWPTGSMNPPIEAFEQDLPILVRRYELVCDSGGPGTYRGGLSIRRDLEIRGYDTRVTSYAMRQLVAPPGVGSGKPGRKAQFVLNPDTSTARTMPPTFTNYPLEYGDVIRCETPGGGGWGDPHARDRELVARDVMEGRVSLEAARDEYGFVERRTLVNERV